MYKSAGKYYVLLQILSAVAILLIAEILEKIKRKEEEIRQKAELPEET